MRCSLPYHQALFKGDPETVMLLRSAGLAGFPKGAVMTLNIIGRLNDNSSLREYVRENGTLKWLELVPDQARPFDVKERFLYVRGTLRSKDGTLQINAELKCRDAERSVLYTATHDGAVAAA